MAVKTKKIVNQASDLQWTVRDENDGVFGPVDFKTLKEWVEDGRVSPLSEISSDEGKNWIAAVSLVELEMNCVAEIEPGSFYGPIHQKAMSELVGDGSIPADAVLFRRSVSVKAVASGHAPSAQLKSLADRVATLDSENRSLAKELQSRNTECEKTAAQAASLVAERDDLRASNIKLQNENSHLESLVDELRDSLGRSDSERDALTQKVESQHQENAELKSNSEQLRTDFQRKLDILNEHNQDLKSRESALQDETGALRSEINSLRKNLHEQQKLMDKRESRHTAELKEKENAFTFRLNNMTLDQENALTSVRQESLDSQRALQEEIRVLQDEIKRLQRLNKVVSREKETLSKRIKELKSEFVAFEEKRAGTEIEQRDRRKLVVLKQLFVEAANLLQDVEDDLNVGADNSQISDESVDKDYGKLLEYEEVDSCEGHVFDAGIAHKNKKPDIVPEPENTVKSASVAREEQQGKKKTSKKWLFANSKKNFNHKSLAELEAQARHELQRLSFQGGDISTFFEKNK